MFQTNRVGCLKNYIIIGSIILVFLLLFQYIPKIINYSNNQATRLIDQKNIDQIQKNIILKYFDFNVIEDSEIILARYTYGKDPALLVWISTVENEEELLNKNIQYQIKQQGKSIYDGSSGEFYKGNEYYNKDLNVYLQIYQKDNTNVACLISYEKFWEIKDVIFKE